MASDSGESTKMAIAIALLRSKLLSNPSQPSSSPSSDALRWKKKAKDRKQDILRLTQELKEAEDNLRSDLYQKTASCKCYFFRDLENLGSKQLNDESHFDQRLTDVLRGRFLRQARLHGRVKKRANKSTDQRAFAEFCREEEETEKLKLSADFLVDLCETPFPVKKPHFTNLAHQAVDFILGSLNNILSLGNDLDLVQEVVSSLIMHLVKRMCTLLGDELNDIDTDTQFHIQHILRKVARVSYIGQRVLLSVSHRISELAESLLFLDPFEESFSLTHDSMFVMIQLIEFLVSEYLLNWSKEEGFDTRLSEEWVVSFLDARKALRLLEKRSGLYALYMDRVTGEMGRQVTQIESLRGLNQDILDSLFS